MIQLAKVAAVEYARDGIRVNCVCPGTFRSAIHDDLPPEALDAIAARHPLGLGAADDLVGAYSYLAERRLPLDHRLGDGRRRRLLGALIRALRPSGRSMPRMKISANGLATSRADRRPPGLQPEVRVVVHAEPGPRRQPRVEVAELAGLDAGLQHLLDPPLVLARAARGTASARSPVSAGNSCRKTQT